jgi:hypothetical protein
LSIDVRGRDVDTAGVKLVAAALAAPFARDITAALARVERA